MIACTLYLKIIVLRKAFAIAFQGRSRPNFTIVSALLEGLGEGRAAGGGVVQVAFFRRITKFLIKFFPEKFKVISWINP